jgi:hypothetical protein
MGTYPTKRIFPRKSAKRIFPRKSAKRIFPRKSAKRIFPRKSAKVLLPEGARIESPQYLKINQLPPGFALWDPATEDHQAAGQWRPGEGFDSLLIGQGETLGALVRGFSEEDPIRFQSSSGGPRRPSEPLPRVGRPTGRKPGARSELLGCRS